MCNITELQFRRQANQWTQRKLTVDGQLLVFHDHNGGIKLEQGNLKVSVAGHTIFDNGEPFTGAIPDELHVVAHTNDFDRTSMPAAFFDVASAPSKRVIVLHVASGGYVRHACEEKECNSAKFVWLSQRDNHVCYPHVSRWVKQFLALDFKAAQDIVKNVNTGDRATVADYEKDYSHLLDIILPGRVENLLAFRLLCNAAKECAGEPSNSKAFGTGLTIHAPQGIEQWLEPFGESKAEKIPQVAAQIASGEVQERVKAVLESVGDTGKLVKEIGKFEDALAEQTASSKARSKP